MVPGGARPHLELDAGTGGDHCPYAHARDYAYANAYANAEH